MPVRWSTWILVAAMVALPAALLAVRWAEPSVGQLPGGWQMHTSCWTADPDPRCG